MGTVSNAVMIGMVVSLVIAIVFPVSLLIYWKCTQKPRIISAIIGAVTFVLFALVLEQLLHMGVMLVFGKGDLLAGNKALASNMWIYGLYGGVCAAVFEEIGRFLAMKFCMKNFLDKKNAIMYGIGHGGIEAIIILGLAEISNIATALAINSGAINTILAAVPEEQRGAMQEQLTALWTTPAANFYLAGVERISAVVLHICLSYMVYRFVKYHEKKYFCIALGMHFLIDFATVLLSNTISVAMLETVLAVVVVGFLVVTRKLYVREVSSV